MSEILNALLLALLGGLVAAAGGLLLELVKHLVSAQKRRDLRHQISAHGVSGAIREALSSTSGIQRSF